MAAWDFWFPDVLVHAVNAPDPLVRQALCRAARDFFLRTRAWTQWLDVTTTNAGEGVEYDFDIPSQTELIRIERATRNGSPLLVQNYRQRPADWTQHADGPQGVVTRDLVTYNLVGSFAAGDVVQVQASLVPSLRATGIPDPLANRYQEPLAHGALARLLLVPDTPYFKPDLAAFYRGLFETAVGADAFDAFRGHTNQVPRANVKWC